MRERTEEDLKSSKHEGKERSVGSDRVIVLFSTKKRGKIMPRESGPRRPESGDIDWSQPPLLRGGILREDVERLVKLGEIWEDQQGLNVQELDELAGLAVKIGRQLLQRR